MATFVSLKTMADGSPRMVIDMQCTLQEIAAMGLTPGAAFGLVRLTQESTKEAAQIETQEKIKTGELCIMACNFCADTNFQYWVHSFHTGECQTEEEAKQFILDICEISSRKELDTQARAANRFHALIRQPFLEWKSHP